MGNQKGMQAALDAAGWHVADTSNTNAVLNARSQTYNRQDYLSVAVSPLFLFGREQDWLRKAEPIAMVTSRHHFRIWKAPSSWNRKEVGVGAGHAPDRFAQGEKEQASLTGLIPLLMPGGTTQEAACRKNKRRRQSFLPPAAVQLAKSDTGDQYHFDGRLLVHLLAMSRAPGGTSYASEGTNNECFLLTIP